MNYGASRKGRPFFLFMTPFKFEVDGRDETELTNWFDEDKEGKSCLAGDNEVTYEEEKEQRSALDLSSGSGS